MNAHRLSRRTFLRAAGVALTLPMLDAMKPLRASAAAASEPPRRMICINTTLGLHTPNLFPTRVGRDYELTPYLEPIKEFRGDLTVFSGLSHPEVDGGHPAELCYLTSAPHPRADNFKNTISLDQFAIEQLVPDTLALSPETIMEKLGKPGMHPEGRFFPDTYAYAKGSSDLAVLKPKSMTVAPGANATSPRKGS